MGAANPRAAAAETAAIARSLGLAGLRIAWVEGDDVLDRLPAGLAETLALDPREKLVSANAYLGVEPFVDLRRMRRAGRRAAAGAERASMQSATAVVRKSRPR